MYASSGDKTIKISIFVLTLLLLVNTVSASENASVVLHGEKTDVVLGEDIILKLSAVNIITKPVMRAQVILIPPSGMSVTSTDFVTSGAGQFTSTFNISTGAGRDIEVRIKANQAGDFEVEGRVLYYFGNLTPHSARTATYLLKPLGFMNEMADSLRHLVGSVQNAKEIGIIENTRVINIIDSVVQRTSFEIGEGGKSQVNIRDSIVQRRKIGKE